MAVASYSSSPIPASFKTPEEELSYYKSQYEALESELQDFQASSRELEAELEKDVEASEKREQALKEMVEAVRYEVEEWKTRYKQSKAESLTAQNALQKEVTTLRESNRSLQMRLRDIEVANDDYERQARNTTSSLEDMESKYNVSLERGVMMEEEIKAGEQEREALRIGTQRLRDEFSDLKIEAEITQEKLRIAEGGTRRRVNRTSQLSDLKNQGLKSPGSEKSVASTSTRAVSTPTATKSEVSGTTSDAPTPPSPPVSEKSGPSKPAVPKQALPKRRESTAYDPITTPRPGQYSLSRPRHTRGPSFAPNNVHTPTPSFTRRALGTTPAGTTPRPRGAPSDSLPRSGSLYQIRGLIGKMQKLEERVQSARSKLPAPTTTPPRTSPRGIATPGSNLPSNITIRSSKKRPTMDFTEPEPSTPSKGAVEEGAQSAHRRNRASISGPSLDGTNSRPSSRTGQSSHAAVSQFARPSSRASIIGRPTADHTTQHGSAAEARRPRSSLGGRATPSHGHRPSIAGTFIEEGGGGGVGVSAAALATPPPPPRRLTLDKSGLGSAIPAPTSALRRQSGRMGPPETRLRPMSDELGDTF